jgi:hypothetical protein
MVWYGMAFVLPCYLPLIHRLSRHAPLQPALVVINPAQSLLQPPLLINNSCHVASLLQPASLLTPQQVPCMPLLQPPLLLKIPIPDNCYIQQPPRPPAPYQISSCHPPGRLFGTMATLNAPPTPGAPNVNVATTDRRPKCECGHH